MTNYNVIIVTKVSVTNTKPTSVKLKSERFQNSIIIPFNYDVIKNTFQASLDIAEKWLQDNGFVITGCGEKNDGYYIISETFKEWKDCK